MSVPKYESLKIYLIYTPEFLLQKDMHVIYMEANVLLNVRLLFQHVADYPSLILYPLVASAETFFQEEK